MDLLDVLAAVNQIVAVAPEVPEPVADGLWDYARDFTLVLIAGLTCWWTVVRPWWKAMERKRGEDREKERERRRREIETVVSETVEPIRDQLTPNGGGSLHDRVTEIDTKVGTVGRIVTRNVGRIEDLHHKVDEAKAVAEETHRDLRNHQHDGERYLAQAIEQLGEQGIHLSLPRDDEDEDEKR